MQNQKGDLTILNLNHRHLTVYYTNVRGLRGNFTGLEAFMLKDNPDIFTPCETDLHDDVQDSDFQLPGYLPIHRKDAGHMHCLGVYVKSNLPIARCVFVWLFYILLPSYFPCIVRHPRHLVLWLRLCHPI